MCFSWWLLQSRLYPEEAAILRPHNFIIFFYIVNPDHFFLTSDYAIHSDYFSHVSKQSCTAVYLVFRCDQDNATNSINIIMLFLTNGVNTLDHA